MPLFRQEALDHAGARVYGAPLARQPVSWTLVFLFLMILGAAAIGFLAWAQFARRETATGVLNYSHGEVKVLPPRQGVVREVFVQDGDAVHTGDRLAIVSTEQQLTSGGRIDQRLLQAIDDQQTMLEARLSALDRSAPLQQQALRERVNGERTRIAASAAALPARTERLNLAKAAAEAGAAAEKNGLLSGDSQRQRRYDYLAQVQALNDFQLQLSQLQATAAEDAANLAKLPSDIAQTRASIQQEIVALEEKRANARAQDGFVLSAPNDGTVTALQARAGQPAETTKPLMTLVPAGSQLAAEIYVPSRAIGFIQRGQLVRLFYDAFPHERFGSAQGSVLDVSSVVLRPEEVTSAVTVKEPVYRVLVRPDRDTMHAYGKDLPLRSGMALTADIQLDKRSLLRLLLDPILATRGRLLAN